MPLPSPFLVVFAGAVGFCFPFCDFFAWGWLTSKVCAIRHGDASKQSKAVVAMKCFVSRMGAMKRRLYSLLPNSDAPLSPHLMRSKVAWLDSRPLRRGATPLIPVAWQNLLLRN